MNDKIKLHHQYERANTGLQAFFRNIYSYLGTGLILTGSIVYMLIRTGAVLEINHQLWLLFTFLLLGLSFIIHFFFDTMSVLSAQLCFWCFTILEAVVLAPFCYIYMHNVLLAFLSTSVILCSMSILARMTLIDLTKIQNILYGSIIGLLCVSILNIIIASNVLDTMICIGGVLLFTILIMWDHQRLTDMYYHHEIDKEKLAVFGALQLYSNVINIFFYMLRLLSKRDN